MSVEYARNFQQLNPKQLPKQEPKTKVKIKRTGWITKGEKVLYTFMCMCLLAFGVFIVSYSSSTDSLNREVQTLEKQVNDQLVINEGLNFEKKSLSRPERILEIAKEKGLKVQGTEVKQAKDLSN